MHSNSGLHPLMYRAARHGDPVARLSKHQIRSTDAGYRSSGRFTSAGSGAPAEANNIGREAPVFAHHAVESRSDP